LTSKQSKPSLKAASTKTPAPTAIPQVELTGSRASERAEKPEKGKKRLWAKVWWWTGC